MRFSRSSNRALILSSLMASSALLAPSAAYASTPAPAGADESAERGIENFDPQPHSVGAITVTATNGGAAVGVIDPSEVVESPGITINNNFTPNDARDPVNINGIGQIVTDGGGGSVGLCTGTLINPRTVLFAAHCVNTRPATAYGANSGGVGTMVGFETNTRANAPGQVDELVNWLLGVGAGPGQFRTNQAQALYNINQVFYDPRSLAPASCTNPTSCFLEADIATGVLDTPAGNIPTWALLFSPLDAPASINPATGTGYHVTISGYGRFGTGTTGQNGGNDFRRRVAENMLGALVSLDQRNLFLFGTTGTPSRPQPLYFLDFDDPARGTAAANPRDFNGFRDNALPREGLTGPGDSGGPLILDQTFSRQVVIGVLSGGSTFFAGQPGGSYGAQSFYQPLFLYWDWIVANNPYRYVTATAGNRAWEDASGWLTELDPNFTIISGGQLVNGLPTNIGAGATPGRVLGFGEQCFQSPLNTATPPATNECENIRTGALRNGVPNNPSDMTPVSGMLIEQIVLDGNDAATSDGTGQRTMARSGLDGVIDSAQTTGFSVTANPAPTIANGLPGATNFVPNNVDGVRATGVIGRYYDVTLRNAGAITLNSAVTIDRFTIRGAASQLNIASGASLTSLIDVQQMTGTINNNGTLISRGDYLLMSGLLTGSGTVRTPFLTSVLGTIAPGTTTSIGTVAVNGNLVLSSGSSLMINLGAGGTSDLVAVTANGTSTGAANVGGGVFFSSVAGHIVRSGDIYTILTATGGVTGTFSGAPLSAILSPTFLYGTNDVRVRIVAGQYGSVVSRTPVALSYAALLDRNRTNLGLGGLYTNLDLQDAATINATLEALAPRGESMRDGVSSVMIDNVNRFYRDRLSTIDTSVSRGGTVATIGRPLQMASAAIAMQPGESAVRNDATATTVREGVLPDYLSAYLAAGYLAGSSAPMPTAIPVGGRDKFDGWYLAGGIEADVATNTVVGFGLSYTEADGRLTTGSGGFDAQLVQGTIYGRMDAATGLSLDTQLSIGKFTTRADRQGSFVGVPFDLRSESNPWTYTTEVGLGYDLGNDRFEIGPRLAFRASRIELNQIVERGGIPAMRYDRQTIDNTQVRAGLNFADKGNVRPYASATFVHDFEDRPGLFGANFVGGVGQNAGFALAGQDQNWVELTLGLAIEHGNTSLSLSADTTVQRSDVRNQAYRASVTMRF